MIENTNYQILNEKEFIYVIGSPRSGTTWLQTMIGSHPAVVTTLELTMFTTYIKPLMDAWDMEMLPIVLDKWHRGLPILWSEDEFRDFLRSFLGQAYMSLLKKKPDATHILDKNPINSQVVEQIKWLVPKARFVHIIRDGRDVAISMVAARKNMGFGTDTIYDSAVQWKDMVQKARIASQYEHYLEVYYEALLDNPVEVMTRVFDFCGLATTTFDVKAIVDNHEFEKMKKERLAPDRAYKGDEAHYRKGKAGTWQEEMTIRECYTFHRIAGDLLSELDYADGDWWHNSTLGKTIIPLIEPAILLSYRIRQMLLVVAKNIYHQFRRG